MSTPTIKYAYLKGHTWVFRRNYPKDVRVLLGVQALKQSLRTGEAKLAKVRVAEVNARYTEIVEKTRSGAEVVLASASPRAPQSDPLAASPDQIWERASRETIGLLRAAMAGEAVDVSPITFAGGTGSRKKAKVGDVAKIYLRKRASELRGGLQERSVFCGAVCLEV